MNEPEFDLLPNREVIPLPAGCPVANHPDGNGFIRATSGVNLCVGLLAKDAPPFDKGLVQVGGIMSLTDWTAATGSHFLAPDAVYYLSTSIGTITTAPPTPQQTIGTSLSPLDFSIEIEPVLSVSGAVGDLDGGFPDSVYGGVTPVDGGGP